MHYSSVTALGTALKCMNERQQALAITLFIEEYNPPPDLCEALLNEIGRSEHWFLGCPDDDILSDDEFKEMCRLIKAASGGDDTTH